jgi:hypothetical protein
MLPKTNFKHAVGWMKPTFLAAWLLVIGIGPVRADVLTGDIAVYNGSTLMGYVSDTYDSYQLFTFTTNVANALSVTIDTGSTPFAILENNPPGANDYFGAVGGEGGYYFSAADDGYAYLSGAALVAAGSIPSNAGNDFSASGLPEETTIWSIDSNNVLTAQWVNTDSTVANPTQIFYDPSADYLGIAGDFSNFTAQYPEGEYPVSLVFTSSTPEPATGALVGIALVAAGFIRRRRA